MAQVQNPLKNDASTHPGLLLEKWHEEWGLGGPKDFARIQLARVTKATGDETLLQALLRRRRQALSHATAWTRKTAGPMTLHLSASGSFENAGICLHPLYGFAYLPGTGIKGMARAYAITIARAGAADINEVFGPDLIEGQEDAACGGVIFYEAWPTRWPRLEVDIVNSHHKDYYENAQPPEDWEQPVPVNFLNLKRGAEFEFAVAARKPTDSRAARLVSLAKEWVDGALVWLGAGAKTNAGYGRFEGPAVLPEASGRSVFEGTLELVSPAFLAGALQAAEDCTLRSPTLRGLLRSWWRTLHSGYLGVKEMHSLEGRLWGTTEQGGLIALEVTPSNVPRPLQFSAPKSKYDDKPARYYLAYGMEGNPNPNNPRPARYYLDPGSKWSFRITAKRSGQERWSSEEVLGQALAALWVLCTFGGAGAKSRRGFGSLDCATLAKTYPAGPKEGLIHALRNAEVLRPETVFQEALMRSPSVHRLNCQVLKLGVSDPWDALDRMGAAYRSFNTSQKHQRGKLALGLPRAIHRRPRQERLDHPAGPYSRHASPLHFRLFLMPGGEFAARISAFASRHLADAPSDSRLAASKQFLNECLSHMRATVEERKK